MIYITGVKHILRTRDTEDAEGVGKQPEVAANAAL